jgi:hypothetical protein
MTSLTADQFARLRELRAASPASVTSALADRPRRGLLGSDGRLFIVAADHPARGALGVGDRSEAMASRYGLLERLAIALQNPAVDGVLGTPDILDDLAALGLLDNRIAVGSMNRGGLSGASFEMDDRFTAYQAPGARAAGLDMLKTLVRINLADPATAPTLQANADAVTAAAGEQIPIMLEPFISTWHDGKIRNTLTPSAVIRSAAIASGLGSASAYTWLKLPVVEEMDRVMDSTTIPTLLLGGDPTTAADETYGRWERALALPGVRGLVAGRTLLYPEDDDVAAAVRIAADLVHSAVATH